MIILQAAIGYGLLIVAIFGTGILVGIPVTTGLLVYYFSKKEINPTEDAKRKIFSRSLFISMIFITFLLFLIWKFCLSRIDLTYS